MNPLTHAVLVAGVTAACLPAQTPAPGGAAQEPAPAPINWKDLTRSGSPIKFYGFLRLDTYYNTARMDNVVLPSRVLPEVADGLTPGAGQAKQDDDQFHMDPRLTRFGVDVMPGEIAGTKVLGKLEIDFANFPDGSAESRATPRIRLAYIDIAQGDWGLRAGQDWDVISPLFPSVNGEFLMWNAGNLGDRRAQLQGRVASGSSFELRTALGLTGAITNQDLDASSTEVNSSLPSTGERDGFDSGMPHLQLRAGFKPGSIVDKKPVEVGVWGMYGVVEVDNNNSANTYGGRGNHFQTWVGGVDLTIPLSSTLTFRGEGWAGENLGDVRGGVGMTINTATGAEIGSAGGWAELIYAHTAKTKFHVGASLDDPNNEDLALSGTNSRRRNQTAYVGTVVDWDSGVRTGLDAIYWLTEYMGADGTNGSHGDAMRFDLYFQYNF